MTREGSPTYAVAVRSLCEFAAKRGDLDSRFTPSTTAQEGVAGHRVIAARRPKDYEREIALQRDFDQLRVRGRADGYDAALNRLEEFKTHRGDLGRMSENHRALHWAQLKTYGAMLCRSRNLAEIELSLVYFDIKSEHETALHLRCTADVLEVEFADRCRQFLTWAKQEISHRLRRDIFLSAVGFPHTVLRSTQRHLSESVYKAACQSTTLMAQAPTGIGKTIGTLFPMLKAVPKNALDRVFFLVAKTSGRAPAIEALKLIVGSSNPPLRVLEYVSRDAACEFPGRSCNGESCPLAKGFYDRLPAARLGAVKKGMLDQTAVREAALSAEICPYYLTQELARWADVVIADYHYYFDTSASLHALTQEHQWRIALLVDEAHNLLPRGRDMYSAMLVPEQLTAARRVAPAAVRRQLDRVKRAWGELPRNAGCSYWVLASMPEELLDAMHDAAGAILDALTEDPPSPHNELQDFLFVLLRFSRLVESFGKHSLLDASLTDTAMTGQRTTPLLTIRNVIPATFLAPRFSASVATVLFSATLAPAKFYRELMGLPLETAWINVGSPFSTEQLDVRLVSHISTRYADRPASVIPIIEVIHTQFTARPGNYLVFFSSFDYLSRIYSEFRAQHPEVPVWEQTRQMSAVDQELFLERFAPGGQGMGFAVLGGRFSEGIDLPGDRLIGAFIATLGLPQFNAVNEQIEHRMEELFGAGYEYTYLYPGIQKVVQAAGRVIRTPTDTGSVHLIDDRFQNSAVRRLLPSWWQVG